MLSKLFSIKYGALALLVLQNTFLVVFMRYSRTSEGPLYASSTAVVMMELSKFITCNVVIFAQSNGVTDYIRQMRAELTYMEVLKVSVPSLVYTVQNNLLYFALSHLDAATYQVCYQAKILTTALFSVMLLNKHLSSLQWVSLVILTAGVSLAQLSTMKGSAPDVGGDRMGAADPLHSNSTLGFIAVMLAAILSGFAGVYFERILKGSKTTLWMRNVQMCVTSIALALGGVYFSGDAEQVMKHGFFYGYNSLVWSVILLQGFGGLVVAVVVKYADNILKGFAASFSIITSCVLCIYLFDFNPTMTFMSGAVLVNLSMYMYSYNPSNSVTKHMKTEDDSRV